MSANGEVQVPAVEKPTAEVPAAKDLRKKASKPVKERKAKVPKEKKPKQPKTAAHPPYFQMIKEALVALNEKSGSSPYAIAKYMEEKHKAVLPANYKKILGLQLKNSATRGKLIKIKASYKLSDTGKKDKVAKVKATKSAPAAKKPEPPTKRGTKRKPTTKKVVPVAKKAKKATPAKPKQPKSIRSPAAKRAKKATA
ncbi:histone H1 [Juglans microcarpa x Juglans regia]|uniref:histone H1 n=1 Tax=Juglans microcarpa x Juglans regia TaxID=2249226 RepID=UPI001B7E3650|nr:histone H1 [Juglans microcarpa x Juglans regia]